MDIYFVPQLLIHVPILVCNTKSNLNFKLTRQKKKKDVIPWEVPFPRPKPEHPHAHEPSLQTIDVVHLSDWHVDPEYEVT